MNSINLTKHQHIMVIIDWKLWKIPIEYNEKTLLHRAQPYLRAPDMTGISARYLEQHSDPSLLWGPGVLSG